MLFRSKAFAWVGIIAVICILASIAIVAINGIGLKIEKYKRQYRIKHRFDKPPTAKCYCRDCKFWDKESGECHSHHTAPGYCMADCWFCYSAEPILAPVVPDMVKDMIDFQKEEGEKRNDT